MDFYTSDTHFFHKNVMLYCQRPFLDGVRWADFPTQEERDAKWNSIAPEEKDAALNQMHETMIRLWNERVSDADDVYHLGDFGFGPWEELAKILARLNGRRKFLVKGNHDKSPSTMKKIGFDDVFIDGFHSDAGGWPVYLRHKPNLEYGQLPFFGDDEIHLCGHIHDLWARQENIINVGVDQSWFAPLTLEELLNRPKENCWIGQL